MIELWYAPTPNGWKATIMLEETGLPYRLRVMDLKANEQNSEEYRKIGPVGKMPALLDDEPMGGGGPLPVFETGAMLIYLAEKSGMFLPQEPAKRMPVISWLMWQMASLGPMLGQHGHFLLYAPEHVPYALERFRAEAARLYEVLDRRLAVSEYVGGDEYSIADIACFPWTMTHKAQRFDFDDYPSVKRWYAAVRARPAVQAGLAVGKMKEFLGGERERKVHGE